MHAADIFITGTVDTWLQAKRQKKQMILNVVYQMTTSSQKTRNSRKFSLRYKMAVGFRKNTMDLILRYSNYS